MSDKGKYSYNLERIFHEKARLSIMTSLFVNKTGLDFSELKVLCDLTDGNLSRHIQFLKEAGFVQVTKEFIDNKPHTSCELTSLGREKFVVNIEELERVVKEAKNLSVQDTSYIKA